MKSINNESFNIFVGGGEPQDDLSLFLNQCDGFTFSLNAISYSPKASSDGAAAYSFTIQAPGMTMTESITIASSSTFGMGSEGGWLTTLQVQGYGQNSDSMDNYDARSAMLEQILSQTGILVPPSLTVSWGLEYGTYVLSSSAQVASHTISGFVNYLRDRLGAYENVSVYCLESQNKHQGSTSALPGIS
jgi:hypothetical protein